jgi:hypothetical protein
MSERYTAKDAERQMAWLAKALGKKVQYLHLDLVKDGEDISMMAEPGQHGEVNTWFLHHANGHGYNVHEYSDGGESCPLGHRMLNARDFWDALYIARAALSVDRGRFV